MFRNFLLDFHQNWNANPVQFYRLSLKLHFYQILRIILHDLTGRPVCIYRSRSCCIHSSLHHIEKSSLSATSNWKFLLKTLPLWDWKIGCMGRFLNLKLYVPQKRQCIKHVQDMWCERILSADWRCWPQNYPSNPLAKQAASTQFTQL